VIRFELRRGLVDFLAVEISIVVPAFNEEKLIAGSLGEMRRAMGAFTDRGWDAELIVCDNNSTDRTAELAREGGATVVFEPINQIARSRNRGAAAARGEWLVFVDADSKPGKELFSDVADCIESGRYIGGGCTVRLDEPHFVGGVLTHGWNLISRVVRWAAGSFIFCDAAVFRRVGGFNQELFASEEIDLSRRLKKAARLAGKEFVILHRHPIVTSARKVHLYSRGELLGFFARAAVRPGTILRRRESCAPWYDGRR
jgi:glycosyltransferase involved in cell wall biosynthesis